MKRIISLVALLLLLVVSADAAQPKTSPQGEPSSESGQPRSKAQRTPKKKPSPRKTPKARNTPRPRNTPGPKKTRPPRPTPKPRKSPKPRPTRKTPPKKKTPRKSASNKQTGANAPLVRLAAFESVELQTCASLDRLESGGEAICENSGDRFLAGEPVFVWAKIDSIRESYQYQLKTYHNGKLLRQSSSGWTSKKDVPVSSYLTARETNSLPGTYRTDLFINVGNGFQRIATKEYAVEVLSPVEGYVRHQCHWPEEEDVWAFCDHEKTGRGDSRGIAMANDGAAIDINLRDYADAGKLVYPVAPGVVVRYGDQYGPGDGPYAGVLIEHTAPDGKKWWSGYLHMRRDSVRLRPGQFVDVDHPIGRVGQTGTSNSHLHVVVYKGENKVGKLRSTEVVYRSRTQAEMRRVARARELNDQG